MTGNSLTARCATALIATATLLLSIPFAASPALSFQQKARRGDFEASVAAPPTSGVGWQAYVTQNVPQGTQNFTFTYSCPDAAPTPLGNSFSPLTFAKRNTRLALIASFRPTNEQHSWEWELFWDGGAPANSQIRFNIYCVQ